MKFSRILLSAVAVATVAACGNLSKVTADGQPEYVEKDGVQVPQLKWPNIDKSAFNHDGSQFGSWPNWDNVRMVERGMNKDQIYNLLGRPHFAEGLYGVEEWDYAFNYREQGIHKICQYKVLFDKNHNAQSFFWYPNGCNGNTNFVLSGDFLFDFDKDTLTRRGREVVDNVAAQLKSSSAKDVKVAGYTDRLGSDAYNMGLSQRRANRVKARLIEDGVTAQITAIGYGKNPQVKACPGFRHASQEEKDCLRPNRRVEITSAGSVLKLHQEGGHVNGGPQGPAPLYESRQPETIVVQ
ncbi:outer membrane protein, ompa/motb [Haemophilus pittmaniae]|mgnify:FL=1|uniref:Outer membrane protein, ompa/motb n=1 Tax=Haemophilus pittmaniae TaxID=249188 RepID=A0A377J0H6_9PAST|nr:OmpA family protein [Haemophilus pittmaniae]MBS6025991.1 outer membrane protein assembly factor BamE [Haemophilus pittmaniae]STO93913.1 outer membrane protein, ompa/motb [Haemophilus pittmaniae]